MKSLKFHGLADYGILQIMFSELTKKLCQSSFRKDLKKRESKGKYNLKKRIFRTKLIEGRVSVKGISLWNNVNKEIEEFQSNITY